jgi:hypothetical protein
MRHPWKMRTVVGETSYSVMRMGTPRVREVLDCGHDVLPYRPYRTVDFMKLAFQALEPDKPIRRRCYKCAETGPLTNVDDVLRSS